MTQSAPRRRSGTDWERVFIVPILTVLALAAGFKLFGDSSTRAAHGFTMILEVGYRVLLLAFYGLAIVLLLIRSEAKAKSPGLVPRLAAYTGTFLPFLLPFVAGSEPPPALATGAVVLQFLGMGFTVYALWVLGRSFGVAPQARTLVQTGPYRMIRHPLYTGEIVSLLGAVLFSPSLAKFGILVAVALLQGQRAVFEERLLSAHLPGYAEYMTRTKRFIPHVF